MTKQELAKCAQLDLLKEVKRICDENNISYFLVGGTLIGAVRHQGFIPWDDDIDIGMLRKDYDRFIEVCRKELDQNYHLFDWWNDPNSPIPFLKLKIKNTQYVERLSAKTNVNDEIFIDIFPYDNAPDSYILQVVHGSRNAILKKIILLKCGYPIQKGKSLKGVLYMFLQVLSYCCSGSQWKRLYEKNMDKYKNQDTGFVVSLGGAYSYKKECKRISQIVNYSELEFEKEQYSVPKEYDSFLAEIYGDYMSCPSPEKQKSRHEILYIDLGDYKVRSKLKENAL